MSEETKRLERELAQAKKHIQMDTANLTHARMNLLEAQKRAAALKVALVKAYNAEHKK